MKKIGDQIVQELRYKALLNLFGRQQKFIICFKQG